MKKEDLLKFASGNGFTQISPGGVTGVWDDYVTLITANNSGVGVTFSATVKASDKKSVLSLNKLIKGYGIQVSGWNDKRAFFVIKDTNLKDRSLSEYLDILARCLRDVRAYPQLVCAVCGQPDCDVMAIHGGEYARAHEKCIRDEVKRLEIKRVNDKKESKGSHLQGLPGAIIGAAVGAFIDILIMVFTGSIIAVAFAFVPVFSYLTYKKWRGAQDNIGCVICGAVSVYAAYMMVCFNSAFTVWINGESGFTDAMNDMLTYLFTASGFPEMTMKAAVYFAVTVCALFFTHRLTKPKETPQAKPDDILKTMVKL